MSVFSSCAYRVIAPAQIGESVRIEVRSEDNRLLEVEPLLVEALGSTLHQRLGWSISPHGSAILLVTVRDEHIESSSVDERGITTRWTAKLHASVEFTSELSGKRSRSFQSNANYSSLDNDMRGLRSGAQSLASNISSWLENDSDRWVK